jgi:hypothetical protein
VVSIRKSSEDRLLIKWQLDNPQKAKNIATFIRYYDESRSFDSSHFQDLTGWPFAHFLSDIDKLRNMDFCTLAAKQQHAVVPDVLQEQLKNKKLEKKWAGCERTISQVLKKIGMGEEPNASIFKYNTGYSLDEFHNDIDFLRKFVSEYDRKHY